MPPNRKKVPARHLLKGGQLCTGETILGVSRGVRTPAGKVEITLERNGARRVATWGASTTINVIRPADPVACKVEALGTLLSELAKVALAADGPAMLAPHADTLLPALTALQLICSATVSETRKEVKQTAL